MTAAIVFTVLRYERLKLLSEARPTGAYRAKIIFRQHGVRQMVRL